MAELRARLEAERRARQDGAGEGAAPAGSATAAVRGNGQDMLKGIAQLVEVPVMRKLLP